MVIPSSVGVEPHPGSYVDPAGKVYQRDGQILRGVRAGFAEFYADLLQKPLIKEMLGRQIIETEVAADVTLNGYPLVLRHRMLSPVSFAYEWPAPMLREAALLTLGIELAFAEAGLSLQDASPWNVVFEGPRPIFIDFTSIVPQDPNLLWIAYDQFCRSFLFPLALYGIGFGRMTRALLSDAINGITDEEVARWLPSRSLLRMPWLVSRVYIPRLLLAVMRRLSSDRALGKWGRRLSPNRDARRAFFRGLQKDVRTIPLTSRRSRWTEYYGDIETFFRPESFNPKQAAVARILDECRPKTVVDIGCNRGGYSIIAARLGARVTSFDTDEESVGLLYELVRKENLNVLPLVMDVVNPSPACGWRAMEYPPAPQRFRSEMVLALALIHHLAITQRQTFERIVPALADYAEKWLLTEFVPLDDLRAKELLVTSRRDLSWYSLGNYITALRCHFPQVETLRSFPEGRVLILCSR